jgi:myosin heavy subunit
VKPKKTTAEEVCVVEVGSWHFMEDLQEAFVLAQVLRCEGDSVVIVEGNVDSGRLVCGAERRVPTACLKFSIPWIGALTTEVGSDDLVQMDEVNEASILHNLRTRFSNELIYTSVGDILVAINPFQWLNLYSDQHIRQYHSGIFSSARPPPHVFHVASEAYRHMTETKKDQTILISGESGAGKTECTKQCVTYLSSVAGHGSRVAERILAANPLLEAFGNAKTSRNDNSSRFGKFMQIIFDDQRYQICGCETRKYLLEKSRIVSCSSGERNYHFFYQLCAVCSSGRLQEIMSEYYSNRGSGGASVLDGLDLGSADTYAVLNAGGCTQVHGVDDAVRFEENLKAMRQVGLSSEDCNGICQLAAAVLHVTNIHFEEVSRGGADAGRGGGGGPLDAAELKTLPTAVTRDSLHGVGLAASLLEVAASTLQWKLLTHVLKVKGRTAATINHSPEQAEAAAQALAKGLYGEIFDWLVDRINTAVASSGRREGRRVGVSVGG